MSLSRLLCFLALFALLVVGAGATTEISTRATSMKALAEYVAWLQACQAKGERICNGHNVPEELPQVEEQKRKFDNLNNSGSQGDVCGIFRVIAVPFAGMHQDCQILRKNNGAQDSELNNSGNRAKLAAVLSPTFLQLPEIWLGTFSMAGLLMLLAIVAGGIGSLVSEVRRATDLSAARVFLGFGLGFAAYALMLGGSNLVPALGQLVSDGGPNPFAVACIGFLFGAFSDRAFELLEGTMNLMRPTTSR